jgi:hypothetical protein
MAKKDNRAEGREDKARVLVRRILERGPLFLDDAIKKERDWRRWRKEWGAEAEHVPEKAAILNELFEKFPEKLYCKLNKMQRAELEECDELLRALCADKIEAALPPSPWRDYAIRALRRPAPPSPETLRRSGAAERNFTIAKAVLFAEGRGGLKPTRNRAQRYRGGAHSACSLVAEELKRFGVHLGEDAIEKLYRRRRQEHQRFLLRGRNNNS